MSETDLGYIARIRMFSRNARLYVLHVIGMDMIHGTWSVLFNLYLLAVGFDITFIGLRLLLSGIAGSILAVPAGIVADRIGRKPAFVLGDGVGAALGLVQIMTTNQPLLLMAPVLGAFFGALHEVSEPPFMHENSRPAERVHLFSVSDALRTASAMVGALAAGLLPALAVGRLGTLTVYRTATLLGLGLWFASLAPAILLRERSSDYHPETRPGFFAEIEHPGLIARLVASEAVVALGAGLAIPLFSVFFAQGLDAHEHEIGVTFALGQALLAVGALTSPFLVSRMTKVSAVCLTRSLSLPFIAVIGVAAAAGQHARWALPLASVAWIGRTTLYNMSNPIATAFSMEILSLRERATMAGLDAAASRAMAALGAFAGSRMMADGDYATPFLAMAVIYAASIAMYWTFFHTSESREELRSPVASGVEAAG